jgi:hypothetical protein
MSSRAPRKEHRREQRNDLSGLRKWRIARGLHDGNVPFFVVQFFVFKLIVCGAPGALLQRGDQEPPTPDRV